MKIELLNASDQWLSAALNGLYQGMIVTLLAGLGLRLVGRINATTRHAVWLGTLLVVVALLPAHYWRSNFTPAKQAQDDFGALLQVEPAPAFNPGNPSDSRQASATYFEAELDPLATKTSEPTSEGKIPPELISQAEVVAPMTTKGIEGEMYVQRLFRFVNPASWNKAFTSRLPEGTSLVLMFAWLMVAGARLGRLGWHLEGLRRLKRGAFPAQNELSALLQELRKKLGVKRSVELRLSSVQRCPVALGFLHPVILLPAHDVQTGNLRDTEPILKHELAHVSRRDDWANLLQQFIQAILFFHPAVWWISKQLSVEREIACDDSVINQGGSRRAYALMLADMAGRLQRAQPLLAPVVSSSKSQLQQRINMILNTHRNTSSRLAKVRLGIVTSVIAAAAFVAVYSWPRLVLAENPNVSALPTGAVAFSDDSIVAAPAATSVNAVDSESADAPSAAVSTNPGINSGPKFKPDADDGDTVPRPPARPTPPRAPVPPAAPPALGDLPLMGAPRPARPAIDPQRTASLEERLTRVERMLEKLIAKQKDQPMALAPDAFGPTKGPDDNDEFPGREKAKRAKEREKELAVKERERAAKQQAKQLERDLKRRERGAQQGEFGKQLESLHKEREALEREVEKLDQQIDSLQQDQERIEDQEQGQEQREVEKKEQEKDRERREQEKRHSGLGWPDTHEKQDRPYTVTTTVVAAPPVKTTVPVAVTAPVKVTAPVTTTVTTPATPVTTQTF